MLVKAKGAPGYDINHFSIGSEPIRLEAMTLVLAPSSAKPTAGTVLATVYMLSA